MSGATDEPSDTTIIEPNKSKVKIIGINHHFFLVLRKIKSSSRKLIL